jgi:hypothetical protein
MNMFCYQLILYANPVFEENVSYLLIGQIQSDVFHAGIFCC